MVILCLLPQNVGMENKIALGGLLDKGAEKSPSKTRQPRKVDLRARYWAFLFDNLRRAVDEIYVTCESDQSVVECRVSVGIGVTEVRNASHVVSKCVIVCGHQRETFEITTKLHSSHSSESLLYVRRALKSSLLRELSQDSLLTWLEWQSINYPLMQCACCPALSTTAPPFGL